jgi:hypothetical protein
MSVAGLGAARTVRRELGWFCDDPHERLLQTAARPDILHQSD